MPSPNAALRTGRESVWIDNNYLLEVELTKSVPIHTVYGDAVYCNIVNWPLIFLRYKKNLYHFH